MFLTKKIITGLFFLCCLSLFPQQWKWAYKIDTEHSGVREVAADGAGNGYFMGVCTPSTSTFYGANGPNTVNGLSSYVLKYDAAGNIKLLAGGWGDTEPSGFSVDNGGNTFITGNFRGGAYFGKGSDTLHVHSYMDEFDAFLAKLDVNGKAKFVKAPSDTCGDNGETVTVFPTNELIHTGYDVTQCAIMDHTITEYCHKHDASTGNILWTLPSSKNGTMMVPTKDNGFLRAAYYSSPFTFEGLNSSLTLPPSAGKTDIYIVKYSLSGEVLWAKTAKSSEYDFLRGCFVDKDNNIVFAFVSLGGAASYENTALASKGAHTMHFVKTDASGNYINHYSLNASPDMHMTVSDLEGDKEGNIYVSAILDTTRIIGKDTVYYETTKLQKAMAIIKFDPGFNYLWSNIIKGSFNVAGRMAVTDSMVYFGTALDGFVSMDINGSAFTYTSNFPHTSSLIVGMRNGKKATVGVPELARQNFKIYPNPGNGHFSILADKPIKAKLLVTNMLGLRIFNMELNGKQNIEIDLSAQPKGTYFVEMQTADGREISKLIVE